MRAITLRQAINEALAEEMARDPKVFLMGEDIATGGAYSAVTEGLPGYSIELIDLLSLSPLDLDAILASVAKTSRLLLLQEDYGICSISEHIAYEVYSSLSLKSKIVIVSSRFAPVPFSPPLERYLLPQVEDIIEAIKNYFK